MRVSLLAQRPVVRVRSALATLSLGHLRRLGQISVLAALLLVVAARATRAQQPARLADQVQELSAKVDEALRSAAEGSTAAKALQELQVQLTAFQQELARLNTMSQGYEAARRKIAEYESRLGNLELDMAALKTHTADQAATAGFKDGFFIQSPNRAFLLSVGGLVQAAYLGRVFSEERLGSGTLVGNNESTFLLKRARLEASGHLLNWRLAYGLELEFGSVDPGPVLEGWGELSIHRALKLRAGKQKIPFSRQFIIHSAYQQFVERSGPVLAFAPGWDLGVVALGEVPLLGILAYQIGMFNGAGSAVPVDDNTDFLYAARVVYQPLGPISYAEGDAEVSKFKVAVGGSFAYNLAHTDIVVRRGITDEAQAAAVRDADGDGDVDNVGIYLAGAELTARLGGLAWQNELFYRQEDPGAVGATRSYWGAYSQASFYHFDSSMEAALRYAYYEPNYYGVERASLRPSEIHEVAAVINALVWVRRVKLQFEYAHQWLRDLRASGTQLAEKMQVNQATVQMQVAF